MTIYVWGLLVSIGFLAGILSAYLICKKWRLDFDKIFNLSILLLIVGLFGGRLFWWLEHFDEIKSAREFFNLSAGGLSSSGGFVFGGVVLAIWFFLLKQKNLYWQYLDVLAIAFIPLWIFSRLGCFLIHDHLGRYSNSFLAVNFSGGARFDMALFEILLMILIGIFFLIFKSKKEGDYALKLILMYSLGRFFLDFLRATDLKGVDSRYFGLTLAQYIMIGLFITACLIFKRINVKVK